MSSLGIEVVGRIPVLVPTNPFSARYLETKRSRMRHAIPALTTSSQGDNDGPFAAALAFASNDQKQ
jgi:hypothetical protein